MRRFPESIKPWPRAWGLFLALGALFFLLAASAMTAQAFVTKVGETTLTDFASGVFHRTGLLNIPAQSIDSVQLVPIGLFGTWRVDPHGLPVALTELSAVAGGGHLVVMGGIDSSYKCHDEVYVNTIGSDGALGTWVEQDYPLPNPLSGAAATIYPAGDDSSWIYVLGGITEDDSVDTVYYTTLHHDTGTIDPWIESTYPLSIPAHYLGAVAQNGYLYVAGGYSVVSPHSPYTLNEVYYAAIQPDGSLGPWQATESLPEYLSSHLVVAYNEGDNNTLYVIGGGERPGLPLQSSFHVYFADVKPDGSLWPWQSSEGDLPSRIYAHGGALIYDQIFVTGGRDANNTISDTVKAALVDPENPDFRLYDWCLGEKPPTCTIGAWESGPLLPEPRAFHVTVQDGINVYTIGGVGSNGQATDSIYRGSMTEPGTRYSPWGNYTSSQFDFKSPVDLRKIEWDTSIAFPDQQTLDLRYRYKKQGGDWLAWSTAVSSVDGSNELLFTTPITNVRLFQYRIDMTTDVSNSSPLLNSTDVFYELGDPEVEVRKDTGSVISVTLSDDLEYTIYYTNNGEWVAESVVLTETLSPNMSYTGGSAWQRVGASDVYTYLVGNLQAGVGGSATFKTRVNDDVPEDTLFITNNVQIGFPPMIDAMDQTIVDPKPENNVFEFSNPFLPYAITLTKDYSTATGNMVHPGQRITYTLIYSNPVRTVAASNAYVLDQLPQHTMYVPGTIFGAGADDSNPAQLRWDLTTVAPGQSGQLGYVVTVDESTQQGTILSNDATLYSDSGPAATSNSVKTMVTTPNYDLRLTKDALPAPRSVVAPGSFITYTISYTNSGSVEASQAVLTDTYDAQESYTIVSVDPPASLENNVWEVGSLEPGEGGSATIVVKLKDVLPDNWTVTNRAILFSPEGPSWYSPVITHVVMNPPDTALADLVVTNVRVIPAAPEPGQPVDCYATISNEGNLDADGFFWVALYIKPSALGPPTGPSDHDFGYCLNNCSTVRPYHLAYIDHLAAGASIQVAFTASGQKPSFPAEGTYDVYVQADVAFGDPYYNYYWGVYPEADETNNVKDKVVTVGGPPRTYMPVIFKRLP